jgi:hypothetical protein
MEYKDISVNFKELSELTGRNQNECRNIFKKHLNEKTISEDREIKLLDLEKYFNGVKSHDMRFDVSNELRFRFTHQKNGYRKILSDPKVVKAAKLVGAYTIYYKICDDIQLEHINKAIKHNHVHSFGLESYNNKIKTNGSNT